MTKRLAAFRGAWIDESLTGGQPFMRGMTAEQRQYFLSKWRRHEAQRVREFRTFLLAIHGIKRTAPIIREAKRQIGIWRFEQERREVDAEPSQWSGQFSKLRLTTDATIIEILVFQTVLASMPTAVIAILNARAFHLAGLGFRKILETIISTEGGQKDALLTHAQVAISQTGEYLRSIKGRRGRKRNIEKPLRAVHAAIVASSRLSEDDARHTASVVLIEWCGIPAPKSASQLYAILPPRNSGKFPEK